MIAKLLPCPICGQNKVIVKDRWRKGTANRKAYWVVCEICGNSTRNKYPSDFKKPTKATEIWNEERELP